MPAFTPLNAFDFHHRLEQTKGISLVLFTHDLCGSCQLWKKILKEVQETIAVNIFEVDAQTEMALTNEFDVFHLPALFLYYEGRYHAPLQSVATVTAVQQAIDELLSQPALDMP